MSDPSAPNFEIGTNDGKSLVLVFITGEMRAHVTIPIEEVDKFCAELQEAKTIALEYARTSVNAPGSAADLPS